MLRFQVCGRLSFPLETLKRPVTVRAFTRQLRLDELDGRLPPEHRVPGPIHRAHSPFAQFLLERVLAQFERFPDLPPQAVDHVRSDGGSEHERSSDETQSVNQDRIEGVDRLSPDHEQAPDRQNADDGRAADRARHERCPNAEQHDDSEHGEHWPERRHRPAHVSRCEVDVHGHEAERDATLESDERQPIRFREPGKRPSGSDDHRDRPAQDPGR